MNAINLKEIRERRRLAPSTAAEADERHCRQTARTKGLPMGTVANRAAAAARHAAMAPILWELKALSPQKVAAELERRGKAQITYKTVERVRRRLGLPDWRRAAPSKAAEPRRRQVARKANREIASATE